MQLWRQRAHESEEKKRSEIQSPSPQNHNFLPKIGRKKKLLHQTLDQHIPAEKLLLFQQKHSSYKVPGFSQPKKTKGAWVSGAGIGSSKPSLWRCLPLHLFQEWGHLVEKSAYHWPPWPYFRISKGRWATNCKFVGALTISCNSMGSLLVDWVCNKMAAAHGKCKDACSK